MDETPKLFDVIWDNYVELGRVQKTEKQMYVLSLAARQGVKYLNIREFYWRAKDQTWRASMNGMAIPFETPIIDKASKTIKEWYKVLEGFRPLLQEAMEKFPDFPIVDPVNTIYKPPEQGARKHYTKSKGAGKRNGETNGTELPEVPQE